MTHEILHGLGFGSTLNTDAGESPWILLTTGTGGRFNGSQPVDSLAANVQLSDKGDHLASTSDLMGSGLLVPTPISDLDIAIMNDLGFGPSRPSWLDTQVAGPNQPPPRGTSANMIFRDGAKGNYEIYNVGNNAILAGYSLGQVGINWQFVGLGGFNNTNAGQVGNAALSGFADTTDMILRDSNSGALEVYDISNNTITSAYSMGAVGLNWQVAGFGDFSSSPNETDMIMRNSNTGTLEVYDITNNAITSAYSMGAVGLEWQVVGFGNFSGNANETDMIMRNSNTGAFEVYDIANNALTNAYSMGAVGLDWQVVGFGNFSGNGNETDMILRNSNTGALEGYNIANNALTTAYPMGAVGLNWQVGGIAPTALSASAGTMDDSSQVASLVQAMAGFDGSGAADDPNTVPMSADTSQQTLLTTPQHA